MFKIGDFSRICRVPVSALRYYADIGLLEPLHKDSFTGYRYYSLSQLPALNRILALKDLGLSLDEIKRLISDELSMEEIRRLLKLKEAELQKELQDRQAMLRRVSARIHLIEQEHIMHQQEVILKSVAAQPILSIRRTLENPALVGEFLAIIFPALYGQGILPAGAPGTLYHDLDFQPENMDVEIFFPIADTHTTPVPINESLTLKPSLLPAGEVASLLHKGNYEDLAASYAQLGQWLEKNAYELAGPAREYYLSAPDSPEGALTEIQFPVQNRA
ncbi:MerR family transcriptional regulator [Anaerolineales bacterium]